MKELVGKLSRGIIEYNNATICASELDIDMSVEAGKVFKGQFSVYSEDDRSIKGIVYSTNSAVKILNNQFIGKSTDISYEIDTTYMEDGEEAEGKFIIVSNAGELIITYSYMVETHKANASIGDINDLFNFTNLVKTDYDEAVRLFEGEDFKEIFLKDDILHQSVYDGLIRSRNINHALEEFLVAINKKSKITLALSDTAKDYDNLAEPYGDVVILTKDSWGYVDIDVEIKGDFITECKKGITSEDFAGSNYEYSYLIDNSRLYTGMNYGKIIFKTTFQTLVLNITVDNTQEHDIGRSEVKRCIYRLMEMYIDFRSRRYSVDSWCEQSLSLIERARGFVDDNDFLKLVQAQIYLTRNREEEAEWLLDSVADNILDDVDNNLELYCYYLYIRTLQRRDSELTTEMFGKIRSYYENGYDSWKILWILLYLDNAYENNESLKLARIKEQFKKGCKSPLMYYEAISVLLRQPALLRVINDFELQVLNFGSKHNLIDLKLALQIAELSMLEKNFRPLLFRILTSLYEKHNHKLILTAICSILIRGNITNERYFKWYEQGVKKEINLTRLYEYYMFSIEEGCMDILPNMIYMYFVYNGNLLFHRESYLYANIIYNKEKIPNVYKNYKANMEKFAIDNLIKGNMDESLAVIYREFLQGSLIRDEIAKNIPHILATYEVRCSNANIERIIVIHKELAEQKAYILRNGVANIEIFTEDAVVLAEDGRGNRFLKTVDIHMKKLLDNNSLLQLCHGKCDDDIYYIAVAAEQFVKYHNVTQGLSKLFNNIMNMGELRYSYRKLIMKDIIEYYYSNYDGNELDEYLRNVDKSELDSDSRNKVIELFIMRGLYKEAYEAMSVYGYVNVAPRRLMKFVSRYISLVDESEDTFILNAAAAAFRKGKYNDVTLEYLCKYYNGMTKEMVDLWKTAKEFSFESRELEERLIAQILFCRTRMTYLPQLYEAYVQKGASELITKAYFFFLSYLYFVKEQPLEDRFFVQLEKELATGKISHDILHEVCKAAYLKHMSEAQTPAHAQKKLCYACIEELAEKGYLFECFRKYHKWFELPGDVADKTVIEYRTSDNCNVYINYTSKDTYGDSSYEEAVMTPAFGGVYTKEFTIFHGENILYYITEESDKGTNITESQNYFLEDDVVCVNSTAYGMLNDILRCKDTREESTIKELTKSYYVNKNIAKKAFNIL